MTTIKAEADERESWILAAEVESETPTGKASRTVFGNPFPGASAWRA